MIRFLPRFVVPRIRVIRVPEGDRGTMVTAGIIARLMKEGARDFYVRQKAIEVLRCYGVRPKDRLGEACALLDFVRRRIRYTRDIFGVELLHTPRRLLEVGAGDCDDVSILLGAMLLSVGHPVRLVLAGYRPAKPHRYTHIYPEVNVWGRWLAADPTLPHPLGWEPRVLWKSVCELGKEGLKCWRKTR